MIALPSVLAHGSGQRIGVDDVDRWRRELDQLDKLEDRYGGAGSYELTVQAVKKLRQVREDGVASEATGRDIDRLIAESYYHAGWCAYDLDKHDPARALWMEGLHAADIADDDPVRVMIYATLAMQADDLGRGREAVTLAHRAQRCAAGLPASRRLRSLLLAREAEGLATTGDLKLAWKTYAKVEDLAADEPADDDGQWMKFWGPGDLAAHRFGSARRANDLVAYEAAARDAVAAVDGDQFPRNAMSYQAALSDALVRRGQLDEALPLLVRAVVSSTTIGSARIRRRLNGTANRLEAHRDTPTVAGTLDWVREQLPAAV